MENQELVERLPSPEDRRVSRIEPRVSARQRARIEATLDQSEARCFGALTASERRELLRLLDKCLVDLDEDTTA
jgi:DNA-binding MarR family transcriptional regulator